MPIRRDSRGRFAGGRGSGGGRRGATSKRSTTKNPVGRKRVAKIKAYQKSNQSELAGLSRAYARSNPKLSRQYAQGARNVVRKQGKANFSLVVGSRRAAKAGWGHGETHVRSARTLRIGAWG